jgi:hypothetical protein
MMNKVNWYDVLDISLHWRFRCLSEPKNQVALNRLIGTLQSFVNFHAAEPFSSLFSYQKTNR